MTVYQLKRIFKKDSIFFCSILNLFMFIIKSIAELKEGDLLFLSFIYIDITIRKTQV